MTYTVETSLADFPAWSGAVHTLDVLIEKDLCDTVEACLVDVLGEYPTDTEINDMLWFETDAIAVWCGFSSWEALENGKEEEEETEEEEAEENNFSRWCNENYPACQGCPYEKLRGLADCEAAYYHDNPDNDDGIRLYK